MAGPVLNEVKAPDATSNPGLAVDAGGNPVVDPTKNVLDLVAAEGRRQDELREAAEKLSTERHDHTREMVALRSDYEEKLRLKESDRLDAIRAVDVAAAALREEKASAAASVLATQVQVAASTLRDLVASTATAAATAAAAVTNPLADRIAQLERSSYEGSGKSAVVDPMMARMVEAVEALRTSSAKQTGREGLSQPLMMALVAAVTGLVVFLVQSAIG